MSIRFLLTAVIVCSLFFSACAGKRGGTSFKTRSLVIPYQDQASLEGTASWYGRPFHGRKTANGERYNMYLYTVAHKELPFGTWLAVTNLNNNKTVKVRDFHWAIRAVIAAK